MKTSRVGALALVALCGISLAGCGGKPDSANDSAGSAANGPPPPPPLADGTPQIVNSTDGVHIQYRRYGSGDPVVMLVHGWSCDSSYWSSQIDLLKARYTTVTVDLAGHGGSARNRTNWTMARFGEDVAAVARELPDGPIVLVGHSMGAPVALEAARHIGGRVVGVIAVDSLKTVGQPPVSEREIAMRLKPFRDDFIGQTRQLVGASLFTKDADPLFIRKVADDMSLAPAEVAIPSMEALIRMDYAKILPDIHVPVVAINSELGGGTDEDRIRKALPTFSVVTVPGTGHFLMLEAPEKFNPVLMEQIRKMAGGR